MAAPAPRSVLSLDVGRKRIGLAGCDPLGLTVKPLPALH
ncbi:MAG: Holliday junction resolvase RuvX, partial [Vulcanococcus sp.]